MTPEKASNSRKGKEKSTELYSGLRPTPQRSHSTSSGRSVSKFPSTNKQQQDLKFVSVTEQLLQGAHDVREQKSIRAHVMRDFLRQRSSGGQREEWQPVNLAKGPAQHITRFRLTNAKPRKSAGSRLPDDASGGAVGVVERRPNREILPKFTPGLPAALPPCEADVSIRAPAGRVPIQQEWQTRLRILTRNIPPGGGTRAFAELPIDATAGTYELIQYYKHVFWQNSLAVNPENNWFPYAATDPAMFHITLSLVAQHRNVALGQPLDERYYYHRGEAIRIVTSRLGHSFEEISDATIGTVAVLSSTDQNLDWPHDTLRCHIDGLERMVSLRGGVRALGVNETLKRVVTWADLVHATSHDTIPRLGKTSCNVGYDLAGLFNLPEGVTSLLELVNEDVAPVPETLQGVFSDIRTLCVALESTHLINMRTKSINRRVFSNLLYHVEYSLLDPNLSPTPTTDTDVAIFRQAQAAMGPVERACRYAGLIFTYLALRQFPTSFAFFDGLVQRLRVHIQQLLLLNLDTNFMGHRSTNPNTTGTTVKTSNSSLVLWLLVEGWTACSIERRGGDRAWFRSQATEISRRIGISSERELKAEWKKVAWLESHCGLAVHTLWLEISTSHGAASPSAVSH